MTKWKKIPIEHSPFGFGTSGGNYVLSNDEMLISYQPWEDNPNDAFMFEALATAFSGDDTKAPETALHIKDTNKWYILKGDWRKEYEKLYPDKKKCLAFYKKMKKEYGFDKWSSD